MKVGFIGTGIMGSRMAINLVTHGYDVCVHNRTQSNAQSVIDTGATWAESPAQMAEGVDVLITMLAHPQAVTETALGDNGFLDQLNSGAVWMDCSTVNPMFSRQMAEEAGTRGVHFLDAPVAGSKGHAENAQLLFVVGGDQADVETCQPLFDVMGRKVLHVGAHGMGTSLKMVLNHLLATAMLGFVEGMALGESLGISQETLFDSLLGGPVVAPFVQYKRAKIESGNYEADFPLRWMHKDLQMVAEAAYDSGVAMPLSQLTKSLYQMAIQNGLGNKDFSAIHELMRG